MSSAVVPGLGGLVLLVLACGWSTSQRRASQSPGEVLADAWSYDVNVVEEGGKLTRLAVEMCFPNAAPARVAARHPGSPAFLLRIRNGETPLGLKDGWVDTSGVGNGGCIDYDVELEALSSTVEKENWTRAFWLGPGNKSLMTQPSTWLLRPERYRVDPEITVSFSVREGLQVSTPWRPLDSPDGEGPKFAADATLYRWLNYIVVGEFIREDHERAGAQIQMVRRGFGYPMTSEGWRGWIFEAVDGVALLYGRFPRDRLQVVALPLGGFDDAVPGGTACRGGGPGVQLYFNNTAQDADLPGGWVTIHELLHLGMPFIKDNWMSEGFVTYYAEVLRTRQGHRSETRGWAGILSGFERGSADDRNVSLRDASRNIDELGAYHRVYWSGAALALQLDVAIREDSGGRLSLDDAMREVRECCMEARTQVTALSLLEHLDGWYGKPLFTQTVLPRLEDTSFPDIRRVLTRLGISGDSDNVELDPSEASAAMREAIMGNPARN